MTTGPTKAPDVPGDDVTGDHKIDFLKMRYQEELDAWQAALKQNASDNAARVAAETIAEAARLTVEANAKAAALVVRTNAKAAKALAVAAAITASKAAATANEQADRTNEAAMRKTIHDAYVASSQSSLDRAMTRVNYLTAAITAVTGLYTGLLALVYSADKSKGKALTVVALMPALFLGLSLFLVTIWAAMFRSSRRNVAALSSSVGGQVDQQRLAIFMEWCSNIVVARSWALHAGIVSFGIGVATLPSPFVKLTGWQQLLILLVGLFAVAFTAGRSKYNQLQEKPPRWRERALAILHASPEATPTAAHLPGGAAFAPVLGDHQAGLNDRPKDEPGEDPHDQSDQRATTKSERP